MMIKTYFYIPILAVVVLMGCTVDEATVNSQHTSDARELSSIEAVIDGGTTGVVPTRLGTVTRLVDYVGRQKFKIYDEILLTEIRRTQSPIASFTYPGDKNYEGIKYKAGTENAWTRVKGSGEPERVYWTDAQSAHTFIGYSIPQDSVNGVRVYDWSPYKYTQGSVSKTYYIGSLGDFKLIGGTDNVNDTIVFADSVSLANEDLLLSYNTNMQAETGGSVALVKFYHALSSVRVIVNISGFSAGASATADNATVVSNMRLLDQRTMYMWMQDSWGAQRLRSIDPNQVIPVQYPINQTKSLKLWCPLPAGSGSNQSKTFTFYGITTPHSHSTESTETTTLVFNVTYPNPLKPSTNQTKTYKALLEDIDFEPGYNTTINISLNHENEQMTVGAEYESWQFVSTPDVGELRKNSTFLQSLDHDGATSTIDQPNVTIVGDTHADADDATWLYLNTNDNKIYDIYGHTGDTEDDAYQISTAYQLLSFAYEVSIGNNGVGRNFSGKYIKLDADLTLQKSASKTLPEQVPNDKDEIASAAAALEWIGIGDDEHAFNGTFLGGNRFIYRLYGKPLFMNIGPSGRIEQLNVNALPINNQIYANPTSFDGVRCAVNGSGLFAETNAGRICGSRVVGDVALSGASSGAFIGTNTGVLFASYHIGITKGSNAESAVDVGGLVGRNTDGTTTGIIDCCYQAGEIIGKSPHGITPNATGIITSYFNNTLFPDDSVEGTYEGLSSAQMTKQDFATKLNNGIRNWLKPTSEGGLGYTDYKPYHYVYNPANYPTIASGTPE